MDFLEPFILCTSHRLDVFENPIHPPVDHPKWPPDWFFPYRQKNTYKWSFLFDMNMQLPTWDRILSQLIWVTKMTHALYQLTSRCSVSVLCDALWQVADLYFNVMVLKCHLNTLLYHKCHVLSSISSLRKCASCVWSRHWTAAYLSCM